MSKDKITQKNRLTYSETVRVNLGDYEHRDVFISFSTDVEENETNSDAYKRVRNFVQKKSNFEEKKLRNHAHKFADFDTKEKLRK